jgi:hypothetical protein
VSITGGSGASSANGLHLYFDTATNTGTITAFHSGVDNRNLTLDGKTIGFTIAGSDKAKIDGSGRLLVGTSTARSAFFNGLGIAPSLQIEGTGGARMASIYSNNTDGGVLILGRQGGSTSGGNALVANNDEIGLLTFQAGDGTDSVECARIQALIDGTPGANDMPGRLVFSTTSDSAASPSERMRITSGGNLNIGRTSDLAITPRVSIESANFGVGINTTNGGAGNEAMRFYNAGTPVGTISTDGSSTAYNTSSDYRLKENVVSLTGAIDRLNDLQVRRFNFIADPDHTVDGFIAHEAQAVVPECVTGEKDAVDADGNPVYQGIDQSKLVPLLTAALQEALQKIEDLEGRLTAAGL